MLNVDVENAWQAVVAVMPVVFWPYMEPMAMSASIASRSAAPEVALARASGAALVAAARLPRDASSVLNVGVAMRPWGREKPP
jgi:hypothetical protein